MDPREIKKPQDKINSQPIDDFEGLSATQIKAIIYFPFSNDSIVQFSDDISTNTLFKIPILRLLILFMDKVKSEDFSLTKTGNLSTKMVKELYSAGYISEYMIDSGITKLYKEDSSMIVHLIHILSKLCGYVLKRKDKLVVTKKGKTLLENPKNLIQDLFLNHAFKFNHGYFDAFPETEAGTTDLLFTLFLLRKYGDKDRPITFYSEKLRIAFPDLLFDFADSSWSEPEEQFDHCIETRVFHRFLFLYGFISGINSIDEPDEKVKISKTDIFDKFFKINYAP